MDEPTTGRMTDEEFAAVIDSGDPDEMIAIRHGVTSITAMAPRSFWQRLIVHPTLRRMYDEWYLAQHTIQSHVAAGKPAPMTDFTDLEHRILGWGKGPVTMDEMRLALGPKERKQPAQWKREQRRFRP